MENPIRAHRNYQIDSVEVGKSDSTSQKLSNGFSRSWEIRFDHIEIIIKWIDSVEIGKSDSTSQKLSSNGLIQSKLGNPIRPHRIIIKWIQSKLGIPIRPHRNYYQMD